MATSLRLPKDIEERLDYLAKVTGRSKTFYMIDAICEYMEDLEDAYICDQQMKAINSGEVKSISLEEMMKQYGM